MLGKLFSYYAVNPASNGHLVVPSICIGEITIGKCVPKLPLTTERPTKQTKSITVSDFFVIMYLLLCCF